MMSNKKRIFLSFCLFIFSVLSKLGVVPLFEYTPYYWKYVVYKGIEVSVILSFAWLLILIVQNIKITLLQRIEVKNDNLIYKRQLYTQFDLFEKIIVFVVLLIAISSTLLLFDGVKKIGISIFASAGVAGLVLAFAAQKAMGTIFAGLQIAFTQPIRHDDEVVVENEWGTIEEINLTYVVVKLWDKRRLIVPSTYFLDHTFQNWTKSSSEIIGTLFIYVDYSIKLDVLRNYFTKVLSETSLWDGNTYNLQVTDLQKECMQIRVLVSARNSTDSWDLRVLLREKLIEFIQENHSQWLPTKRYLNQSIQHA